MLTNLNESAERVAARPTRLDEHEFVPVHELLSAEPGPTTTGPGRHVAVGPAGTDGQQPRRRHVRRRLLRTGRAGRRWRRRRLQLRAGRRLLLAPAVRLAVHATTVVAVHDRLHATALGRQSPATAAPAAPTTAPEAAGGRGRGRGRPPAAPAAPRRRRPTVAGRRRRRHIAHIVRAQQQRGRHAVRGRRRPVQVRGDRRGHAERHQLAAGPDHVRGTAAARRPVAAAAAAAGRRHEVRPVVRRPRGRLVARRPGPRVADVLVARVVHIVHVVARRRQRRQRGLRVRRQTGIRPEPAADLPVDEESSPRTE